MSTPREIGCLTIAVHCAAVTVAFAQCEWRFDDFQGGPVGGLCGVLYDPDGVGGPLPQHLVVGGAAITAAGLSPTSGIAAYNGEAWGPLGAGLSGGVVEALLV